VSGPDVRDAATGETAVRLPLDDLPWHASARARLAAAAAGGRLPHALLLHGPDGVGKERFAAVVAAGLLCRQPTPDLRPCGECTDCALSLAASHPDLHWLRIPEDRKTIGVEAVRETCEQLGMTSLRGRYRVAIVVPAHRMTANAQNAFLKTLEEPAPRTLLLLVSSRPAGVLPTLRSRCQRVEIARPSTDEARQWLATTLGAAAPPGLLELAGGAPLRAAVLAPHFPALQAQMNALLGDLLAGRSEVTRTAADMVGDGLGARLDWLEAWLSDAVRARLARDATQVGIPVAPQLQSAASDLNIGAAFRFLDRLRESRRLLEGSAAPALVVEALLIELVAACRRRGVARWVP
jgi:DNA polymerase-3 subunit delta'